MRLNFGCGPRWEDHPGWIPVDREDFGQTWVADVCDGLPFADQQFEWVAAHHVIQMIDHHQLVAALRELRRVGRVLRVSVPDIPAAVAAWQAGNAAWFPVLGTADLDTRFCTYLTWYSSQRVVFTANTLKQALSAAGYRSVARVAYKESEIDDGLCELDGRPNESLWAEAW